MAQRVNKGNGGDLLEIPFGSLVEAVVAVTEAEGPIHETDLFTRIAAAWGTRAGSRVQSRILEACKDAAGSRLLERPGEFFWRTGSPCRVRSRANTRIPAERIAPEEFQEAVLMVLASGHAFSRPQLTTEVRSVLGFSRTGASLEESIAGAIDALLAQGKIGEASTGIRLRR
jgi:hypothetical protein